MVYCHFLKIVGSIYISMKNNRELDFWNVIVKRRDPRKRGWHKGVLCNHIYGYGRSSLALDICLRCLRRQRSRQNKTSVSHVNHGLPSEIECFAWGICIGIPICESYPEGWIFCCSAKKFPLHSENVRQKVPNRITVQRREMRWKNHHASKSQSCVL